MPAGDGNQTTTGWETSYRECLRARKRIDDPPTWKGGRTSKEEADELRRLLDEYDGEKPMSNLASWISPDVLRDARLDVAGTSCARRGGGGVVWRSRRRLPERFGALCAGGGSAGIDAGVAVVTFTVVALASESGR